MSFKILKEFKNPVLARREVVFEVESESNPTALHIKKMTGEKFSAQEDTVKINRIKGGFGERIFKVDAHIYHSKKDLDETEVKSKKQRTAEKKAIEEAKKAEEEFAKANFPQKLQTSHEENLAENHEKKNHAKFSKEKPTEVAQ